MPQLVKSQELRRENLALVAKMSALNQKCLEDGKTREFTPEEQEQWDRMRAERKAREAHIERCEEIEKEEAKLEQLDTRQAGRDGGLPAGDGRHGVDLVERAERREKERKALRAFITKRPDQWDEETRNLVAKDQAQVPEEARAMGVGFVLRGRRNMVFGYQSPEQRTLTAAGNVTVAEDFMRELDVALKDFSGIAQACRFVNTDTGADLPWPKSDDTANKAHLLAETVAAATNVDPTLSSTTLQAFLYTSDAVLVPNQLMQDSAFSVESWLAEALGGRMGRGMNFDGTLADGSSKPRGLITAIMADTTQLTAASATAISLNDIVKLFHGVDPAYRNARSVGFMMHDAILEIVEKILDSNGRPIFRPATDAPGSVNTIYNKPVFINQDMDATVAEDKESIVFGDLSKFIIRRALNPVLVRLNELFALYFQTGFVMFERWDTDLVSASNKALRLLSHNLA